jgi:predicted XRE-type DNA-binding protein
MLFNHNKAAESLVDWRQFRLDIEALFNELYILQLRNHNKYVIHINMSNRKPLIILSGNIMDTKKRKKIEAAGYQVVDSAEWLGLTEQEQAIVKMRVNFALEIERVRKTKKISQQALAERIGTQQSGVARMLNNPASATIDSLINTLLALGTSPRRIAALI